MLCFFCLLVADFLKEAESLYNDLDLSERGEFHIIGSLTNDQT